MSRSKYVSTTVAVIDYYVEEMMLVVSNGTDNPTMNVHNEFNDEIKKFRTIQCEEKLGEFKWAIKMGNDFRLSFLRDKNVFLYLKI